LQEASLIFAGLTGNGSTLFQMMGIYQGPANRVLKNKHQAVSEADYELEARRLER
jgi:hypothetical protein